MDTSSNVLLTTTQVLSAVEILTYSPERFEHHETFATCQEPSRHRDLY